MEGRVSRLWSADTSRKESRRVERGHLGGGERCANLGVSRSGERVAEWLGARVIVGGLRVVGSVV